MSGTIIQFPLGRGLAEDASAKSQPVSTLKTGANVRWVREGTIGKRYGVTAMASVSNARRFIPRGSELSVTDGTNLLTYDSRSGSESWDEGSLVSEASLEWSTIADTTIGIAASDVAISGDLLILTWVAGDPTRAPEATPVPSEFGSVYIQMTNWRTGQMVLPPTLVHTSGASFVRLLVAGGYAFVVHDRTGVGQSIVATPYDIATGTVGSNSILTGDLRHDADVSGRFDAMVLSTGNIALVYEKDNGLSSYFLQGKLFTRSGSTLTVSTSVPFSTEHITALSIDEDTATNAIFILFGYTDGSTYYRLRMLTVSNSTLADIHSVTILQEDHYVKQVSVKVIGSDTVLCVWSGIEIVGSALKSAMWSQKCSGTSFVDDSRRRSMTMRLLSRVFTVGGRRYVFASDSLYAAGDIFASDLVRTFPSSYLVEIEDATVEGSDDGSSSQAPHRLAGKVDNDIAGMSIFGHLPQVAAVDSDTAYAVVPYQADAAANAFNWRCGLRLVRATVDADLMADPWRPVPLGGETYASGAYLQAWDGRSVFDYGMRTPVLSALAANSANGNVANGNYIYQFGAGFRSGVGVLHRGPLTTEIPVVVAVASAQVEIAVASHGVDGKQTNSGLFSGYGTLGAGATFVEAYRSTANSSVLYKLTYEPRYNAMHNDPTETTVELVDESPDTDITNGVDFPTTVLVTLDERPQPYTASGELEDVQPPAQYTMLYHSGRLFVITGGRREVWYTKDYREQPNIAPGFNPLLVEVYDQDLTALASMDEKRLVFWEHGIWFVVGDGPTASGTDNRFSPPQAIQTDVGCTNPRSVVSFPGGVAFQCDADLYLCDRSLQVSWFGKDVRDELAAYPVITSAVLVASENEIRWTCNSAAGSAGKVLVYDYVRGTWFTRSYPGGAAITDAVLHDGTYHFATAAAVYKETTATHLDNATTFVPLRVVLSPISPIGAVAWARVKAASVIGESLSNHQLTIGVARDWSTSTQQTKTFAAGSAVTAVGPLEQARIDLAVQKVQAVEIQIEDVAPANASAYPLGSGAGINLEGVALLVKPKSGLPRMTATRRG
jgi:hypothetical protein